MDGELALEEKGRPIWSVSIFILYHKEVAEADFKCGQKLDSTTSRNYRSCCLVNNDNFEVTAGPILL